MFSACIQNVMDDSSRRSVEAICRHRRSRCEVVGLQTMAVVISGVWARRCFKVRIWLPGALVVESSDDVAFGDTVAVLASVSQLGRTGRKQGIDKATKCERGREMGKKEICRTMKLVGVTVWVAVCRLRWQFWGQAYVCSQQRTLECK
jgi:hypothetical protein